MSGHSKWATIKRQKGANDAKRGQLFTKLSNAITIAVRQGGGITDPTSNFKLRLAIDKARAANMPKDNIERAIQKAISSGADAVQELMYEGFAPGGIAVIVEAVTDNKQRTVSDVKNIFDKSGGSLGNPGSVSYLFNKRGEMVIKKNGADSDELLSKGIDAGVEDMEEEQDSVFFYTDPSQLANVKRNLEEKGLAIESAEIIWLPINYIASPDNEEKVMMLIEKLEDLDDVQKVYTNLS